MAWNTPGGAGKDGRRPRRGGSVIDQFLDSLRGLFGNGAGGSAAGGGGIGRWAGMAFALWLAFNCFVLITEQQRGVVLRFGQFARIMQPGPHFKLPWPVERVIKVSATQIKTFSDTIPVLTRDENIVSVEVNVQYRVGDAQQYLFGSRDADQVLQQAALSAVREQVGRSDLDTVLNARPALAASGRKRLQASLDTYQTGLVVTELNLPNARPPEEVKDAFDDVNRAQQDKDRLQNEAQAYAKKIVPEARGEAARTRTTSEGYKTASIARAEGDAQRFSLLVDQYKSAPDVTRKRLWLETVQHVLADNRKIVGGDSRQLIYVPMDDHRGTTAASSAPLLTPDVLAPASGTDSNDSARPSRSPRPTREEERR